MSNPCESCPNPNFVYSKHRRLEGDHDRSLEALDRVRAEIGACSLLDVLLGKRASLRREMEEKRSSYTNAACEAMMVSAEKHGVDECEGPFVRTVEVKDSEEDKHSWEQTICGARIHESSIINSRRIS